MDVIKKTVILGLIAFTFAGCAKKDNKVAIEYQVGISDESLQNYHIKMDISGYLPEIVTLFMPVWTPGDYKPQNFARYVMNFQAHDDQKTSLPFKRVSAHSWQVKSDKSSFITVEYDISTQFENKLGLSTAALDTAGGYFTGTCIFLYSKEYINNPITLTFNLPQGWKIATPLPQYGDGKFKAEDYHHLVDSPVEIGHFFLRKLPVGNMECTFVFNHDLKYDEGQLNDKVKKVVSVTQDIFKNTPFKNYYFFFHWKPDIPYGGGMEHGESVVMNIGKQWMPDLTDNAIGTIAHEFFHAWNVKRIRPKEFYPYDYSKMIETPFLWFAEGITYYYTVVVLIRAGIIKEERFLRTMASNITYYEDLNSNFKMSIEESSLIEYIKPIQANNFDVGGIITGFLLDLIIRDATDNKQSFDDVMRTLDKRFGENEIGYTNEDLIQIISEITREDMHWFFDKHIAGTEKIDFSYFLNKAGLSIRWGKDEEEEHYFIEPSSDQTSKQKNILEGILHGNREIQF